VKKSIVFGYVIFNDGVDVDKAKIGLIANISSPTCVKDLGSFFGHVGFYCRFIKDLCKIAKPLSNFLVKDVPFHFTKKCLETFTELTEALTTAHILHPPIWTEPFQLMCDATTKKKVI